MLGELEDSLPMGHYFYIFERRLMHLEPACTALALSLLKGWLHGGENRRSIVHRGRSGENVAVQLNL